jgi:GUN4-like
MAAGVARRHIFGFYKDHFFLGVPLDEKRIKALPCQDLQTIDRLWMYHSNGKFGFSIQKDL